MWDVLAAIPTPTRKPVHSKTSKAQSNPISRGSSVDTGLTGPMTWRPITLARRPSLVDTAADSTWIGEEQSLSLYGAFRGEVTRCHPSVGGSASFYQVPEAVFRLETSIVASDFEGPLRKFRRARASATMVVPRPCLIPTVKPRLRITVVHGT